MDWGLRLRWCFVTVVLAVRTRPRITSDKRNELVEGDGMEGDG